MVKGYTATERMVGGLRKAHWAIQRVMVSKDESQARANEMAKHVLNKQLKGSPIGNFYHFRNIPKTAFIKGTFRTKQIKPGFKLVFGELKAEHSHMVGGGLFDYFKRGYDYVKEKISPVTTAVSSAVDTVKGKVGDVVSAAKEKLNKALTIDDYSKNTKANLAKYGTLPVVALTVYRKPVEDWINTVFQGVSVGKWEALKKKYGMDKFFHLTLVCTLEGGKRVSLEKLEVVSVNENIPSGDGVETQEVPLKGKSFTITDMLEGLRADVGDKTFFSYDALRGNNCQNFVEGLLKSQGLYGPEEKAFVFQDIKSLVQELPEHLLTFQRGTTDLAAVFNKATGIGGGRDKINQLAERVSKIESCIEGSGFFSDTTRIVPLPGPGGPAERRASEEKHRRALEGSGFFLDAMHNRPIRDRAMPPLEEMEREHRVPPRELRVMGEGYPFSDMGRREMARMGLGMSGGALSEEDQKRFKDLGNNEFLDLQTGKTHKYGPIRMSPEYERLQDPVEFTKDLARKMLSFYGLGMSGGQGPMSLDEQIQSLKDQMHGVSKATRSGLEMRIMRLEEMKRMQGSGLFDFLLAPLNRHKLD
jgi:hypothetical protein